MDLSSEFEKAQKRAFSRSSAVKQRKVREPAFWGVVQPSEYLKVYGPLKAVKTRSDHAALFANGTSTHSNPLISRSSVQTFPGLRSFDTASLTFLRELRDGLNASFKVDLDDELFTSTGIHTNFDRLACPAGYFQNPMSYTAVDNSLYREELGLSPEYSPRQRAIMTELWKIVASDITPAPVNVPKMSTGGMRRFTSDPQWKLSFAEWLLDHANFESMLNMVDSKDSLGLANTYETVYATYIQKRGQVDEPGKVRTVFDLEYALSGGRKGGSFPTDKKVVIDGREWSDFSAIRARVVHAGPWTINCFLQILSSAMMRSMFERFPTVFHINTPEQIEGQTNGRYIYCSDVTEYDRSMSRDAIRLPHDVLKEFWDPRIIDASWRLFTSPYYAKPLDLAGRKGLWVLDPMNWDDEVFAGNRSGHAWTSLLAKVNKVGESLFVIDKIYPVLGRVKEFLLGKMPMGLINNGDDEVIWSINKSDMNKFARLREDKSTGHYLVNREVGNGFSGSLLVKPTDELRYVATAKIHTSFEKMWVPERPIGGLHRPYWPIGFSTRVNTLSQTDLGREALEIHMHTYRKILMPILGEFHDVLASATSQMDLHIEDLTTKDRDVLDSPDKLHYLYDEKEISPKVLDEITSKIPISVTEPFIRRYFTGSIH